MFEEKWYHNIIYFPHRVWFAFVEFLRSIKYFYQRGKNGYSERDLWDWGYYMAEINIKALKEFKNNLHAYPLEVKSVKEWKKIIGTMTKGWEAVINIEDYDINDFSNSNGNINFSKLSKYYKKNKNDIDKGLKLYTKYIRDLWD